VPQPEEHERWAQYNESFARSLKHNWPTWTAVAAFYAALHYVDSYLRGDAGWNPPRHEENHRARNDLVRKYPGLSPYLRLYHWGHDARYQPYKPQPVGKVLEALEQTKAEISRLRAQARAETE
jgi:hypothetical protein